MLDDVCLLEVFQGSDENLTVGVKKECDQVSLERGVGYRADFDETGRLYQMSRL